MIREPNLNESYSSKLWGGYQWSSWVDFSSQITDNFRMNIPKESGIYRVMITECNDANLVGKLMYIGISQKSNSSSVYKRTRSLISNTLKTSPPYNDPHTAAPCLWAYTNDPNLQCKFAISVTVPEFSPDVDIKRQLQCMEDRLLFLYRIQTGHSTIANHGHFHQWYDRPQNRSKGKPVGLKSNPSGPISLPSQPPSDVSNLELFSSDWLGWSWSAWEVLRGNQTPNLAGIYRLKEGEEIVYFGQAKKIYSRLQQHHRTYLGKKIQCSYFILPQKTPMQEWALNVALSEREVDTIGAYYEVMKTVPLYQYLNYKRGT